MTDYEGYVKYINGREARRAGKQYGAYALCTTEVHERFLSYKGRGSRPTRGFRVHLLEEHGMTMVCRYEPTANGRVVPTSDYLVNPPFRYIAYAGDSAAYDCAAETELLARQVEACYQQDSDARVLVAVLAVLQGGAQSASKAIRVNFRIWFTPEEGEELAA